MNRYFTIYNILYRNIKFYVSDVTYAKFPSMKNAATSVHPASLFSKGGGLYKSLPIVRSFLNSSALTFTYFISFLNCIHEVRVKLGFYFFSILSGRFN